MIARRNHVLVTTAAAALILVACGGAVTSGNPGEPKDSGTPGDSATGTDTATPGADGGTPGTDSGTPHSDGGQPGTDGGSPTACPSSPPSPGSSCDASGLQCEYGSSPNLACNQVFGCEGGAWQEADQGICPTGTCPATYASVPANGNCSTEGLECGYPQGECICSDGGGPARVGGPGWTCIAATSSCPDPRPTLGSACSDEGASCDYGACYGSVGLVCQGGTWQQNTMIACPS